jgi:ribosomal protein S16
MGRVHRQWSLSAPLSRMDLMSEAWGLLLPPRTLRRYALTTFIAPPRFRFSYPAMTVRIRLARFGRRKEPFYRLVAADRRCPRDGRHLEVLGEYDPIPSARPASLQTFFGLEKELLFLP